MTDGRLLELLSDALAPEATAPDASDLARLHDALAARPRRGWPLAVLGVRSPRPLGVPSRHAGGHRPVVWIAASAVAVAVGLGSAGVSTDVLPGPLRAAAFDIGLPVSSPAVVATRADAARLGVALAAHDSAAIRRAAATLRRDLDGLDTDDLASVEPAATTLLAQAQGATEDENPGGQGQSGSTENATGGSGTEGTTGSGGTDASPGSTATETPATTDTAAGTGATTETTDGTSSETTDTTTTVPEPSGTSDTPSQPMVSVPLDATDSADSSTTTSTTTTTTVG